MSHRPTRARWLGGFATLALVAGATAAGRLLQPHLADADVVMIFLLVIAASAARLGLFASLLASALSVLAFDFFFVAPVHTFAVRDERYVVTFLTMFVVGALLSALTARLRRQEQAVATANLRAETEAVRSSLLSAISHDLRTPLASITGAASTLRESGPQLGAAQRSELIDAICDEAARLERFVTNLLEMTRLEAGAAQPRREWVPLEELIGVALTRLEAELAGRQVDIALPEALPLLHVDPVLLQQVFFNVLDNAVKHTPKGSPIGVSARADAGTLVVEIADRGPGATAAELSRMFDKFVRGEGAGAPGSGLGLAICRAIVTAHGGTIEARPRAQGGTVFSISLPLGGEPPAVPRETGSGA